MTLSAAITKAQTLARKTGSERFVVFEPERGEGRLTGYHVATAYELDTYYAGIPDNNVVYCAEG